MAARTIYITVNDMKRLGHLLINASAQADDPAQLEALDKELETAKIVRSEEIPPDVVTMNSRLRVKNLDTQEERVFSLVYPDQADAEGDRVSILDPLGTAVLGFKAGARLTVPDRSGAYKIKIVELLYQPEAARDFHL